MNMKKLIRKIPRFFVGGMIGLSAPVSAEIPEVASIEQLKVKVPDYFVNYGIDGDKFYNMYNSLRLKGLEHAPAFYVAWLSIKERPKGYYSFGSGQSDLTSWANHAYGRATGKTSKYYGGIQSVKNYNEYRKAAKAYNSKQDYWDNWLTAGMSEAEQYINQRRK